MFKNKGTTSRKVDRGKLGFLGGLIKGADIGRCKGHADSDRSGWGGMGRRNSREGEMGVGVRRGRRKRVGRKWKNRRNRGMGEVCARGSTGREEGA